MRKVSFLKAGRFRPDERVFLTTRDRQAARYNTIYHRNRYSTILRIPADVLRRSFTWLPRSGVYWNKLTYADLSEYMEVIDHETGT